MLREGKAEAWSSQEKLVSKKQFHTSDNFSDGLAGQTEIQTVKGP